MGATVFFGYTKSESLHVTLNRQASNALESLLEDALQEKYPEIYEKIMEVLPLDQIQFLELNPYDFNIAVKTIRDYIACITTPTEWQLFEIYVWMQEAEPLVKLDPRYDSHNK